MLPCNNTAFIELHIPEIPGIPLMKDKHMVIIGLHTLVASACVHVCVCVCLSQVSLVS